MSDRTVIDFSHVADNTPVCLLVLDAQQQLVWGNQAWQEYTGGDCQQPLEVTFAVHPDDQVACKKSVSQVYEKPRRITLEFNYQRKDGEYRPFQLIGAPRMENDQVIELVCALTDITDQQMIEEQMLALNDSLEDMVEERTLKLKEANEELKATQSQMLHHEKMASVGQLAAGVAHEINNPMGFISSNLGSLAKYLERLGRYIEHQDKLLKPLLDDAATIELKTERKKMKIDYLLEDSDDLISESLDGAERVQEIVRNLKSFSRVDQAAEQAADINECLESTIAIAWNELKYKVTLDKDYGELPPLFCHPQQLNQVFMNLLVNGAQAIAEKGTIGIKTWHEAGVIYVQIKDDGCGIPPENLSRIFEPFFTTKDVGKGTGLGMSISYDIVRAHDGDIHINSVVGEGTQFTIELPVKEGKSE